MTSGVDLKNDQYSKTNIGIPYITGASNFEYGNLIINRYTFSKFCNSTINDILLTCKGTVGKICQNKIGNIHIARQIMGIKSFVNENWIILFLQSKILELTKQARSLIPGIDREAVLNTLLLLPPLNEQIRISDKVLLVFNQLQ